MRKKEDDYDESKRMGEISYYFVLLLVVFFCIIGFLLVAFKKMTLNHKNLDI